MFRGTLDYLAHTREIEHFGWNTGSLFFLATMFISIWQGAGILFQGWSVWSKRSVAGLDDKTFASLLLYCASAYLQGISVQSFGGVVVGGTFFLLFIPVVGGLLIFNRGFSPSAWFILVVGAGFILFTWFNNRPDTMLLGVSLAACIMTAGQPWKMYKESTRGVVSQSLLWTSLAASTFWALYTPFIGNWTMSGVSIVFGLVWVATLKLYYKYP